MMGIDIEQLTEEALVDLNNRIVARLRFLAQARAHAHMMAFAIGERVSLKPDGRSELSGVLTRYNKKTVTVITDAGEHWNVSPAALKKIEGSARTEPENRNVVPFPGLRK
jgi:hypothetical protein